MLRKHAELVTPENLVSLRFLVFFVITQEVGTEKPRGKSTRKKGAQKKNPMTPLVPGLNNIILYYFILSHKNKYLNSVCI